MIFLYRCLLYLYPPPYRREYGKEMIAVFRDAQADVRSENLRERISFRTRETLGLLAGAVQEHLRIFSGRSPMISFTRFDMRPEFRFPRSTVVLMSVIFGGVMFAMKEASAIQAKYGSASDSTWRTFPGFAGLTFVFTLVTVAIVWAILFALGRTGVHRLANIQAGTKPE
jgi:hypothetical protein